MNGYFRDEWGSQQQFFASHDSIQQNHYLMGQILNIESTAVPPENQSI